MDYNYQNQDPIFVLLIINIAPTGQICVMLFAAILQAKKCKKKIGIHNSGDWWCLLPVAGVRVDPTGSSDGGIHLKPAPQLTLQSEIIIQDWQCSHCYPND